MFIFIFIYIYVCVCVSVPTCDLMFYHVIYFFSKYDK